MTPEVTRHDEHSQAVQAHMGMTQAVIERMATSSSSTKAWCVTLVSAILVLIADGERSQLAWIAALPTLLFATLDAYYLALERGFRQAHNDFVRRLHAGEVGVADLYLIEPQGSFSAHLLRAYGSFSIWPFYLTLLAMIYAAQAIIL